MVMSADARRRGQAPGGWTRPTRTRAPRRTSRRCPGVPAARYADPDFAALEQDAVFGRTWLMVAHVDELAEPGDFRLVDQLPEPVVLVRGADDERPRVLQHVQAPGRRARGRGERATPAGG